MFGNTPPLFPKFQRDEFSWITSAKLPAFSGFQIRNGPYGAVSSEGLSDGMIHIVFAPEGRDDSPLTPDEIALVRWVIDHEKTIHDAAMARLLADYPSFRQVALEGHEDQDYANEIAPPIATLEELKSHCGIVSIHVHPLAQAGAPFFGIEFGCTWEIEHGLGILLHGNRPLECGYADVAFTLWMAEQHANHP